MPYGLGKDNRLTTPVGASALHEHAIAHSNKMKNLICAAGRHGPEVRAVIRAFVMLWTSSRLLTPLGL